MPKFGKRSTRVLSECHEDLQTLFNEVIKTYDCSNLEGHRPNDRQNELYAQGKSKAKGGKSKHNSLPSMAIDTAPYPIDWADRDRFLHFAGYVMATANQLYEAGKMKHRIRGGHDWNGDHIFSEKFFDAPHFELVDD